VVKLLEIVWKDDTCRIGDLIVLLLIDNVKFVWQLCNIVMEIERLKSKDCNLFKNCIIFLRAHHLTIFSSYFRRAWDYQSIKLWASRWVMSV
jgi:hypothetical protein